MYPFPAPATPAETPFAENTVRLRWEDVAQDGRIMITALAPAIGSTIWNGLLKDHAGMRAAERQGLVSILTRLTAVGTDEPIRVIAPVCARGTYQLAHSAVDGAVDRLFMNAWVEVHGTRGKVWSEPAGPQVPAGRMFVEHTFTRLFEATPDKRKVKQFDVEGMPVVPEARYDVPGFATAMELPAGAEPLDDGYVADAAVTCFGLEHTDSNQHVNSLVYPRLFAEAALRRLDDRVVLVRALDIAYRKPSFAGDVVRIHLRRFRIDGRVGAAGYRAADGETRPRVCARILLA
jgi:hypothetical protein